jgi:catechol 2,3-dioxygenase
MSIMSFAAQRIDHVEVLVHDLERSVRWYGEVLGLKEIGRFEPHPIMIGAGGTMLALFLAQEPRRGPAPLDRQDPHWHLVAFRTDESDFAAAQEHLRSLGIPFRGPIDHQVSQSIYFQDPDGNPLELTWYSDPRW